MLIEAAWSYRYLRRKSGPSEEVTQARRTLANVVLNHGKSGIALATQAERETFVASEFLYALAAVRADVLQTRNPIAGLHR
jgi:hypothetical protein